MSKHRETEDSKAGRKVDAFDRLVRLLARATAAEFVRARAADAKPSQDEI